MDETNQPKHNFPTVVNCSPPPDYRYVCQQGNPIHNRQSSAMGFSNLGAQLSRSDLTVVVQQPRADKKLMVGTIHGHRDWSTGICDCFLDCADCLLTWLCLPCAICKLASRTGECCCTSYVVPGAVIALRSRIRTLGGIQGTLCDDFCTLCWCTPCAVCQMSRELDRMGVP